MKNEEFTDPIKNHRRREKGVLVYPVYSRRAGGLSVGINLFPDKKICSFNCPYCEVFPFSTNAVFSAEQMEEDLRAAIAEARKQNIPVKDICFSGNGEPSLSAFFPGVLERAALVRAETAPDAELVLITNGTGLQNEKIFALLRDAAFSCRLDIWLKLDAGTCLWYQKMNRCEIPFEKHIKKIKEFTACAPVTIQTMLCATDGGPPLDEEQAWEDLILELVFAAGQNSTGAHIRKVQIYGKARPSPQDPETSPLPECRLYERAASLQKALSKAFGPGILPKNALPPVEIFP